MVSRRNHRRRHRCAAAGCQLVITRELLMCARHWALIPDSLQHTIRRRWSIDQARGGRPSIVYLAAVRSAIDTGWALDRGYHPDRRRSSLIRLRSDLLLGLSEIDPPDWSAS